MKKIKFDRIYKKLLKRGVKYYDVDIRSLHIHIKNFPDVFPTYMIQNNYTCVFNSSKFIWEIWEGEHEIEFKIDNYYE